MDNNAQNTQKQESQPSPYLAFYGLAREPFATAIEFDLFYPEPTRTQRLDILRHLTQYSDELLLVTGPEGSGKSTLLQQYTAKASDTWKVVRIEAKGGVDERNLIQQFYHQLELNYRGATHPELLEQLQHHLDSLVHNARLGVLLVDDAHHLTVTALQRVLQLASLRSFTDKPLLRVILFGEPGLEQKLDDDPLLAQFADIPRRIIDLPPFNEEHSTHYILHRLSAARFVAGEPFSEAALHKLYKQSEGWPGHINTLAQQLLLDSLPKTERPPELPGISDRDLYKPKRLVGVSIIIVIIVAFIAWDVIGDLFDTTPGTETEKIETKKTTQAAPDTTSAEQQRRRQELAIPLPKNDSPRTPSRPANMDEAIAAITQNTLQKKTPGAPPHEHRPHPLGGKPEPAPESVQGKSASVGSDEQSPAVTAKDASRASAVTPVTTAKATPPAPQPAKAPTPAATNTPAGKQWQPLPDWLPAHRNDWLLSRKPQHFTLQLIAGERLDTLRKFITRHKLKHHLAFYQTQRNGKPWYALVYGDYPDRQTAIDARSQLPLPLRRQKPWLRNFDGIQQDLK